MKKYLISTIIFILMSIFYVVQDPEITGFFVQVPQETGSINVHFCPVEDCENLLLEQISLSEKSLHCAFFDLNLESVIQKIDEKNKLGIDTKLVIDKNNYEDSLNKNYIVFDTNGQYSHNKFCIIDNSIVITGSMNPTSNGAHKNDNNLLFISSKSLVKNYEDEFEELYSKQFGKGSNVKYPKIIFNNYELNNYFCPEDDCKDRIVTEINKAEKSIYFMTFSFTHPDISNAIINKKTLDVKGIFEKRQNSKYNKIKELNKTFGTMRWDSNPQTMHHKVFIIDDKTVITGSMNPSKNGDENNDENILIIREPKIVQKFLEEFGRVYG